MGERRGLNNVVSKYMPTNLLDIVSSIDRVVDLLPSIRQFYSLEVSDIHRQQYNKSTHHSHCSLE